MPRSEDPSECGCFNTECERCFPWANARSRLADDEMIAEIARAMGEADRVWFWKTGGFGENAQQRTARIYYEAEARRYLAAHRKLAELAERDERACRAGQEKPLPT